MDSKPLTDAWIAELRKTFTMPPTGNWSIGDALACISSMTAQFPFLLDEVTRARALLRRIEWEAQDVDNYGHAEGACCPECGYEKGGGKHKPDCELAALIGKAQ